MSYKPTAMFRNIQSRLAVLSLIGVAALATPVHATSSSSVASNPVEGSPYEVQANVVSHDVNRAKPLSVSHRSWPTAGILLFGGVASVAFVPVVMFQKFPQVGQRLLIYRGGITQIF